MNIFYFTPEIDKYIPEYQLKYSLFTFYIWDFVTIILGVIILPRLFKRIKNEAIAENKQVLYIIIFYLLYQTIILIPLSLIYDIKLATIMRVYSQRLYYFYFLFFYLFCYSKISIDVIKKYVNISAIILFVFEIYKFINGEIGRTDTGEIRLFWGGVSLIFAYTLFINYPFEKINYKQLFYVAISAFGIITINHRTSYVAFFITIIIAYLLIKKKFKFSALLITFGFIFILYLINSQDIVSQDFLSRFTRIFDTEDSNRLDRFQRWGLAFEFFKENWLNGSLLSNQRYFINEFRINLLYASHNFIFDTLSAEGIIGFSFISVMIYKIYKIGLHNIIYTEDRTSLINILFISFYLVFCLFNANMFDPWNVMYLMIAMTVILQRNKEIKTAEYSDTIFEHNLEKQN